jgi:SAM-dependent methyltransferase
VAITDVQALSFREASVDVVMLMHMLHHVPDVPSALAEARRVVTPNGFVLVTTLGPGHLRQLRDLLREALADVRGDDVPGRFLDNPFDIAAAREHLHVTFSHVEHYVARGLLEIPEPAPVVAYLDSQQGPDLDALLPVSATWADVLEAAATRAAGVIEAKGVFEARTEVGAFVCRP